MSDAKGLTRQQMCDRLAMEFEDGWIVNLGIGIPTLCSNFDFGDKEIIFHSENGVIGYGPLTGAGKEDLHLVNAGGQHVTLNPGAAIVHHADSFGADPQRPHRRDRARRLRGRRERRFRELEDGGAEGRRHRRRDGSGRLRQACLCRDGARRRGDGQPRLVERCAIPVTAQGRRQSRDHQLRAVRDHAGGHGVARDRARRLGRRDQGRRPAAT